MNFEELVDFCFCDLEVLYKVNKSANFSKLLVIVHNKHL